jgi:hypothetical protein
LSAGNLFNKILVESDRNGFVLCCIEHSSIGHFEMLDDQRLNRDILSL